MGIEQKPEFLYPLSHNYKKFLCVERDCVKSESFFELFKFAIGGASLFLDHGSVTGKQRRFFIKDREKLYKNLVKLKKNVF